MAATPDKLSGERREDCTAMAFEARAKRQRITVQKFGTAPGKKQKRSGAAAAERARIDEAVPVDALQLLRKNGEKRTDQPMRQETGRVYARAKVARE